MQHIYGSGTRTFTGKTRDTATVMKLQAAAERRGSARFLFAFPHFLALLALLRLLSVTGKDEVVVVEVGQLAIQAPVAIEFLRRREHAATL